MVEEGEVKERFPVQKSPIAEAEKVRRQVAAELRREERAMMLVTAGDEVNERLLEEEEGGGVEVGAGVAVMWEDVEEEAGL